MGKKFESALSLNELESPIISKASRSQRVVRGSMNLNENPRFEQFDVTDDPVIFNVVAGVESELWTRQPAVHARKQTHALADDLFQRVGNVGAVGWFKPAGKGVV